MKVVNSHRSVLSVARPLRRQHGPGLVTTDLSDADFGGAMNPFIMVSLYDMAGPTFPPHPHAGFSVATYILPESPIGFINQDTLGNRNRIAPGALHVTVAGSGVQHEEQPERRNSLARGFQIWIDHAPEDREIAPYALHLRADAVPVTTREGATIRAVLGSSKSLVSRLQLPTHVRLVDVSLETGASFSQDLLPGENAFVFILSGAIDISGVRVDAGSAAATTPEGELLDTTAVGGSARLILFAGKPLKHPRVQRGPFVASNTEQLQRFVSRFQLDGFGSLTPFSAQPDWQPNDGQQIAP